MSFKTKKEWLFQDDRVLKPDAKPSISSPGETLYSIDQTTQLPPLSRQRERQLGGPDPDSVADDVMSFHENYYADAIADGLYGGLDK